MVASQARPLGLEWQDPDCFGARQQRAREARLAKLALLPRVDHNGFPIKRSETTAIPVDITTVGDQPEPPDAA